MPVRRHLQMAEGYGVEPYTAISRRSFQDCLTHSTVGPSPKVWQGRSDLNRESRFWRPMVCQLAYIPKIFLVHVVGLAPTKSLRTPDLQSGAFAAQPRMRKKDLELWFGCSCRFVLGS